MKNNQHIVSRQVKKKYKRKIEIEAIDKYKLDAMQSEYNFLLKYASYLILFEIISFSNKISLARNFYFMYMYILERGFCAVSI